MSTRSLIPLLVAVALEVPCLADADDDPRTLAGHGFTPLRTVDYPFVVTSVGGDTTGGYLRIPVGAPEGPTAKLSSLQLDFEGRFAVVDWLDLEVGGLATLVSGRNPAGVFTVGGDVGYGGRAGVTARILRAKRFYLSASVEGEAWRLESVVPLRAVADRGSQLKVTGALYQGAIALSAAVALDELIGVEASGRGEVRQVRLDGHDVEGTASGGLGFSFDLLHMGVPLSVVLGGRVSYQIDQVAPEMAAIVLQRMDRVTGDAELGLYYTGREDLELGLVGLASLGADERRFFSTLSISYYW